jgi:hypothetical protein
MRNQFYNKFAHSFEANHNVQAVGTNLYNWVNQKEQLVYEHLEQTMDNGYTILEITQVYRQYERGMPTYKELCTSSTT